MGRAAVAFKREVFGSQLWEEAYYLRWSDAPATQIRLPLACQITPTPSLQLHYRLPPPPPLSIFKGSWSVVYHFTLPITSSTLVHSTIWPSNASLAALQLHVVTERKILSCAIAFLTCIQKTRLKTPIKVIKLTVISWTCKNMFRTGGLQWGINLNILSVFWGRLGQKIRTTSGEGERTIILLPLCPVPDLSAIRPFGFKIGLWTNRLRDGRLG